MSLSEVLVSIAITLAALAGFSSAANQHQEVRILFQNRHEYFSRLSQEIERLEDGIRKGQSFPNCNLVTYTRTCALFSCKIAGEEHYLCAR